MSSSHALSADPAHAAAPSRSNRARFLYLGAAVVLLVFVFLGFRQFYLHGRAFPDRELTPPIRTEVILHAVSTTGWILLFLVQPLLIVSGNRRVHMMLAALDRSCSGLSSSSRTGCWPASGTSTMPSGTLCSLRSLC